MLMVVRGGEDKIAIARLFLEADLKRRMGRGRVAAGLREPVISLTVVETVVR